MSFMPTTIARFQASTLVKYFTKFTKDIFSSLVALLFIFEAIRKLAVVSTLLWAHQTCVQR